MDYRDHSTYFFMHFNICRGSRELFEPEAARPRVQTASGRLFSIQRILRFNLGVAFLKSMSIYSGTYIRFRLTDCLIIYLFDNGKAHRL